MDLLQTKKKSVKEYSDWVIYMYNSEKKFKVERLIDSTDLERYKMERLTESLYTQEYLKEDLENLFKRFCASEISCQLF